MQFSFILFLFCSLTIKLVQAQAPKEITKKDSTPSLINKVVKAPVKMVDSTQSTIDENVTRVANRLDSFFGTQRADDELNRSQIRLIYDYRMAEAEPKSDFAFRVNLRLSNLEEYFKSIIERMMDWETKKTPEEQAKADAEAVASAKLEDPHRWLFRNDVGVIASIPPRAFYRARLRKTLQGKAFLHRFVEELAWFSEEQWINTTSFESDRAMTMTSLFRFVHEKNWALTDQEFTTSHGPSIIHTMTPRDAISYNARLGTRIKGPLYLNTYSLSIAYRRRLRGNWLYGDVTPALDFPKENSFRRAPSILLRIEALFGGIREDISDQNTL